MSTTGLVIGASDGSIGEEIINSAKADGRFADTEWLAPTIQELNVLNPTGLPNWLIRSGLWDVQEGPEFPGFDYVVYAAGVNKMRWAGDVDFGFMNEHFMVNVTGMVKIFGQLKGFYPEMPFSAVALTSDAARNPMRTSIAYCSSKAAQEMAIRVMAREWTGYRINGVAPAVVADTNMSRDIDRAVTALRGWSAEEAAAYERTQLPLQRRVTKTEVAHVVLSVLAGPAYQTGSIVNISGGK